MISKDIQIVKFTQKLYYEHLQIKSVLMLLFVKVKSEINWTQKYSLGQTCKMSQPFLGPG